MSRPEDERTLKNRDVWGKGDTKIKFEKEEVTEKGDTIKMKIFKILFSTKITLDLII